MSEFAAIITAGSGLLTVLGGGFAWVWREVKGIKSGLAECEKRERAAKDREAKYLIVIELLWQAAAKSKAAAPVVARCKEHLDDLKKLATERKSHD